MTFLLSYSWHQDVIAWHFLGALWQFFTTLWHFLRKRLNKLHHHVVFVIFTQEVAYFLFNNKFFFSSDACMIFSLFSFSFSFISFYLCSYFWANFVAFPNFNKYCISGIVLDWAVKISIIPSILSKFLAHLKPNANRAYLSSTTN